MRITLFLAIAIFVLPFIPAYAETDELERLIHSIDEPDQFQLTEPENKDNIEKVKDKLDVESRIKNDSHFVEQDTRNQGRYYRKLSLRGLDKITAKVTLLTIPVGTVVTYGELEITARLCWSSLQAGHKDNKAFIEVYERRADNARKLLFSGWMFSSSPSISSLEHPVYDITLLDCLGDPS